MRYLFVIQGEGRGHFTQALTLKGMLERNGDEVVEVLVGKSSHREIPEFFRRKINANIKTFSSPNFLPTAANKRNTILRSILYNIICLPQFIKSILFLNKRIDETNVDAVINFYELLTGLTMGMRKITSFNSSVGFFCIGHQYLFLHKDFVFPKLNRGNLFLLKLFTRVTSLGCNSRLALSFREMQVDTKRKIYVVPPLLRPELQQGEIANKSYVLGYMVNSGFGNEVKKYHNTNPQTAMHFFWDKQNVDNTVSVDSTLTFHKIDDKLFLQYMRTCSCYATTAGFESVCEAIYLGKPILMVPVHIEQDCNAWDAMSIGAGIVGENFEIDKLLEFAKHYKKIESFPQWVNIAEYRILPLLNLQHAHSETLRTYSPPLWRRIFNSIV